MSLVVGVVAGCGGESDSSGTASPGAAVQAVARTASAKAAGTTSWVICAQENQTCSFPGTQTVRYGADPAFAIGTFTNSVACNNATFGDPAFGVGKTCSYLQTTPAPDTWVDCATEAQFCSFSGAHLVRFGAGTSFVTGTYVDGVPCSDLVFGDPAYGTGKTCSYFSTVSTAPPTSGTACGTESQFCAFTGTLMVRYGAGSSFVTGTFTNGVSCSNATFGDPLPGFLKSCTYYQPTPTPTAPIACGTESQVCAFMGTYTVRYGTATSFVTGIFTNGVSCSNATFGDPSPGFLKSCSYYQTPPTTSLDAARLLDQAAFGPTPATVAALQAQGAAAYIDAQIATPSTGYPAIAYIDPNSANGCPVGAVSTCYRDNYTPFPLQLQFYRNAMTGPDQLRQRVALAYSQIFVISGIDIHETYGMRSFQQMLLDNAFSNYRQLLERVTLNPAMGLYLNMVNNNKPTATVQANENYAREVLQLFSIGLSKLNADGSVVKDANGVAVPSYDQTVVQGFARAFTGWTFPALPGVTSKFTNPQNFQGDMVPFDANHDMAAKTLLNGTVLPAGQSATKDLAATLDTIYNHPNVGTFIGRQLIQALVTSNPSAAYVSRITAVFNDNGSGVRGDMGAVVRAILLDSEARGDGKSDPSYGKLRDPAVDAVAVARAFNATTDGVYLNAQATAMGQNVYTPGSVFSFYPPDYTLPGSATLLGPQFAVNNTATSVARFNYLYTLLYSTSIAADTSVTGSTGTKVDLSSLTALAATPSALVAQLNAAMTHSSMPASETAAIVTAVTSIVATDTLGRTRMAAYLVAASPRYQINR